MDDNGTNGPPDPSLATTPTDLAARLRALRRWAGQPSLRRLRRLAGTHPTAAGTAEIDALPESTTSYVLRGDRPASADFVRSFVTACLRARQRDAAQIAAQVERWHEAWVACASGPAGSAPERPARLGTPASAEPRRTADQPGPHSGADTAERHRRLPADDHLEPRQDHPEGTEPVPPDHAAPDGGGPDGGGPARPAAGTETVTGPPRQLPAGVAGFTGRVEELALLEKALHSGADDPVSIVTIDGPGGVGKSALALHAAHRLADTFPDGQLYVDLHGATAGLVPLAPGEALGRFLRALGFSGNVSIQPDEAAALLRTHLAGRRMLLVLDNAVDEAQVRPLLPGAPGCGVLVTSRRALSGLAGGTRLHLDVLPPDDALALLGHLVGPDRLASDPTAAAQVGRYCGYLPLALRIAGARLAARPNWPLAALADKLADHDRRLDELELIETGVRLSFDVSYQHLSDSRDPVDRAAAAALALLGVWDAPDVTLPAAACLLDRPPVATERVLERLVDAGLLEAPAPGRYQPHDLIRLHAKERATRSCTRSQRQAALERVLHYYTSTAWRALEVLRPGDARLRRRQTRWSAGGAPFADAASALAWLEQERINLSAAVNQAVATDPVSGAAVQLAHALFGFAVSRGFAREWEQINKAALLVAGRAGDRGTEAALAKDLGVALGLQGRYREALEQSQAALAVYRELGDVGGQAGALGNIATCHRRLSRPSEALGCLTESLRLHRDVGDRAGQAADLTNLGAVYGSLGDHQAALACLHEGMAIRRELGDRLGQASTATNIAEIHLRRKRYDEALEVLHTALAICRELSDTAGQVTCLLTLASVYRNLHRYEDALACLTESLPISRDHGSRQRTAENLRDLGIVQHCLGHTAVAETHWRDALTLYEELGLPEADEIRTLLAAPPARWLRT